VVPVGISGSYDILVRGSFRIRSNVQVKVKIGAPIDIKGYTAKDRRALTEIAQRGVEQCLSPEILTYPETPD